MGVLENVALPAIVAGSKRKQAETRARDLLDLLGLRLEAKAAPGVLSVASASPPPSPGPGQRAHPRARRRATGALDSGAAPSDGAVPAAPRRHTRPSCSSPDDDDVAAAADRIVHMVDGRIVGQGRRGPGDRRRVGLSPATTDEPTMALRVDEPAPLVIPTERVRTPRSGRGTPLLLLAVVAALLVGTGLAVAAGATLVARRAVGARSSPPGSSPVRPWRSAAAAARRVRVLSGSTVAGGVPGLRRWRPTGRAPATWSPRRGAARHRRAAPRSASPSCSRSPAGRLDSRARKVGTLVGFGVGLALGDSLWTIRPDLPGWLLWLVSVLMLLCGLPGAHRSYLQTAGLERQRLQWVGCATAVAFEGTLVVVALRLFAGWPSNSAVVAAALTILIPWAWPPGVAPPGRRVDRILVHTVSLAGLTGVVVAVPRHRPGLGGYPTTPSATC